MADIPSNIDKINDIEVSSEAPVTEALMNKIGADINGLIDLSGTLLNSQTFTSSGTFNVPEAVTQVLVEVQGAGGGGAEGGSGGGGAGGGAGERILEFIPVTPLAAMSVTVGAGGAGAVVVGSEVRWGNDGGASVFSFITARGGYGGHGAAWAGVANNGVVGQYYGGGQLSAQLESGGFGGTTQTFFERAATVAAGGNSAALHPSTTGFLPQPGERTPRRSGGSPGSYDTISVALGAGSGGGASYYGSGGNGGNQAGAGTAGGNGGTGAGGGGGSTNGNTKPGDGGNGIVIIRW